MDLRILLPMAAIASAEYLLATPVRAAVRNDALPTWVAWAFVAQVWAVMLVAFAGVSVVAGNRPVGQTLLVVGTLAPVWALGVWYWARHQVRLIGPRDALGSEECPACGRKNPAGVSRCQWCREKL